MEYADFSVKIEETMSRECSAYECVLTDENDVGRMWNFIIEDALSGFICLEENKETIGVPTVAIGLLIMEITDHSKEELLDILRKNSLLLNCCFCVADVPKEKGPDVPVFIEEGEDYTEEDDPEASQASGQLLVIQTRLPYESFEMDDFAANVTVLANQANYALNIEDDDENSMENMNEVPEAKNEKTKNKPSAQVKSDPSLTTDDIFSIMKEAEEKHLKSKSKTKKKTSTAGKKTSAKNSKGKKK